MTTRYERRIRHLEARNMLAGGNAVVIGLPGPQPTDEEISEAAFVVRVVFVPTNGGRIAEGENHARH